MDPHTKGRKNQTMRYVKSEKYNTPALQQKIMGPNPIKLEEELLRGHKIPENAVVCDLGSGQGRTSAFLVKEYGFTVLCSRPVERPGGEPRFLRRHGH